MENLVDANPDDLLLQIGTALADLTPQMRPPTRDELIAKARAWLRLRRDDLRRVLCSPRLHELEKSPNRKLLFDAVCEVTIHVVTVVPAGCVAAYIIQRGLATFCNEDKPGG